MRDLEEEWRLAVLTGSTKAGYGEYVGSQIKKAADEGFTCVLELHPFTVLDLIALNDKSQKSIAAFREDLLKSVMGIRECE